MSYDFVKVYQGAVLTASLSGTVLPASIRGLPRAMRICFTSDNSVQSTGFSARYIVESAQSLASPGPVASIPTSAPAAMFGTPTSAPAVLFGTGQSPSAQTTACSGSQVLTATSGTISDGPGAYGASMSCEWTFGSSLPATAYVTIVFDAFNL